MGNADERVNFLDETERFIVYSGHTTDDIEFIGNRNRTISLGDWGGVAEAIDRKYDSDLNFPEVVTDLAVFFDDHSLIVRCVNEGHGGCWEYIPSSQSHLDPPMAVMAPERVWTGLPGRIGHNESLGKWYTEGATKDFERSVEYAISKP